MLRRNTTAPELQLCLLSTAAQHPSRCVAGSVALLATRRAFFGKLSKQWSTTDGAGAPSPRSPNGDASNSEGSSSENQRAGVPPGFPPGLDLQKLQTLQQLFSTQPKEKQEQMLKQAMEMQKMMSKIPGLGKLTQKNTRALEELMKMRQPSPPLSSSSTCATPRNNTPAATASPAGVAASAAPLPKRDLFSNAATLNAKRASGGGSGSSNSSGGGGPSLDDLRKVNLGPEIEALFQELRTIRTRKNEYRDQYNRTHSLLEALRQENRALTTSEASLRNKLSKAEQNVMLLTSENMELRDASKNVKQLMQSNKQLKAEVEHLKTAVQSSAAPGTTKYVALQQQLHEREDALRSMQRKVERMRRRDPLLQFSLACSNVSRLCSRAKGDDIGGTGAPATASEASQEAAEKAFAELQIKYQERQQAAWDAAAHEQAAAAAAYVAVVRRYIISRVPHSNYDAVVTFTGDGEALRACFVELGFQAEMVQGEADKAHVMAAPDALPFLTTPGPFGYALALCLSRGMQAPENSRAGASSPLSAFTVTSVQPFISAALVRNARRCSVVYETARASGPGGQATNVTETQVYAKLAVDGASAFTAEAQDSRSALNNKESALDKLQQQRRLQFNDMLAKHERAELVQAQLVAHMQDHGGFAVDEDVQVLVEEAVAAKLVTVGDAALVAALRALGLLASAADKVAQP
ncbi:hypothetical protein JKF63_05118 [Porcisia hertigi]|uniref:Prokaryotic-type class I peptide chain release factors domain-containing protein n=1 Tax=Porcisia hertigi TaxID=2761500 RepID=A0A836HU02_9TRYP|nr:hypothetical protein JKF63_05118 [Porcisia hertigi]